MNLLLLPTGWAIHLFKVLSSKFKGHIYVIWNCRSNTPQKQFRLFSQNGQVNEDRSFSLSSMLDTASPFGKEAAWMDEALRGLLEQPMQNFDSSFTPEVTNKLFRYVFC